MKSWLKNRIKELYPDVDFDVLTPPDDKLGDYSTNLAFVMAKKNEENPKEIGKELIAKFSNDEEFKKYFNRIELAGNGFINFHFNSKFLMEELGEILKKKSGYGSSGGGGKNINLEFVSANPTGPSTVHNARAAAFGDTLGNILKKVGHQVTKEFYVNDVGVQVGKLAESIRLRMRELKGEKVEFSPDLYQGEYIKDIAKEFIEKSVLDQNIQSEAVNDMIAKIKKTLDSLGVVFDEWFSESKLHEKGEVGAAYKELESKGYVIEEDGAKWLKMSEDQKAVLIKSNSSTTYLMNDIAYTKNKFERGFDKAINIWGTDHHGDVPRLKAGVGALGYDPSRLEILLHQLVVLKQKDQKLKMSKRAGNLVLLEELLSDVGKDAIRFFFLSKDLNTHMEFDIDLAKEQSNKNPVYYIQYAYARLNQIFGKSQETVGDDKFNGDLSLLKEPEETALIKKMVRFPELVEEVSSNFMVHHLAQYAYELASSFHNFYEKNRVVQDDKELEKARLILCSAVKIVLGQCLLLMGISAPEKM